MEDDDKTAADSLEVDDDCAVLSSVISTLCSSDIIDDIVNLVIAMSLPLKRELIGPIVNHFKSVRRHLVRNMSFCFLLLLLKCCHQLSSECHSFEIRVPQCPSD